MIKQPPKSSFRQFKEFPKQVQKVCMDVALARYDKHYHPRNEHHKKHLITDVILGAIVVFLVLFSAYIFLFYQNAILEQGVDMEIQTTAQTVKSGDELSYELFVENNTGQSLFNTFIEFPQGTEFSVSTTSPQSLQGSIVPLGTLDDGESVRLTVNGFVISDVNESARLNAVFRFDKSSLLGMNEVFASESLDVFGSTLTADLQFPESIVANQPFDFAITYKNESPITLFEQVSLLPNWPPGWEVMESSLPLDEASDFWVIESIGSLEEQQITGKARLLTSDLEEAEITVKLFTSPVGQPLLQEETSVVLPVRYPDVSAEVLSLPAIASLGEQVDYEISVENREEFSLRNVRARLQVNRGVFDPRSYPTALDERSRSEILLFTQVSEGATLTFTQTLQLRSTINAPIAFGNGAAQAILPVELLYEDENGQEVVLPLAPAITQLNTDLSGQAFARYFSVEGDQIGRGPIPPIVGETTKYWGFIHLHNQLHNLTDVNVSGRLAQGVGFTGKESVTEGSSLNYNEGTRFFQWPVGELPDYKTNFEQRSHGAAFELAITPSAEDIDQILTLVESIEVQGRDVETGQIITKRLPDITTNLIQDAYTSDEGRVTL